MGRGLRHSLAQFHDTAGRRGCLAAKRIRRPHDRDEGVRKRAPHDVSREAGAQRRWTKTRRPRKRSRAGAGLSKKRSARVWAAKLASMRLLRGRRMDGEGRLCLRPVSGDAVHQPNRGPERSAALANSGTDADGGAVGWALTERALRYCAKSRT
ncbi:hypothetical protein ERJ75_001475200 [Trypanosoma vivax]|nr:hypothetical protein ERJ75_001475200 [Trypanosoma vivax]